MRRFIFALALLAIFPATTFAADVATVQVRYDAYGTPILGVLPTPTYTENVALTESNGTNHVQNLTVPATANLCKLSCSNGDDVFVSFRGVNATIPTATTSDGNGTSLCPELVGVYAGQELSFICSSNATVSAQFLHAETAPR